MSLGDSRPTRSPPSIARRCAGEFIQAGANVANASGRQIAGHHVSYKQAAERATHQHLGLLAARGRLEKPTQKDQPEATQAAVDQQRKESKSDHQERADTSEPSSARSGAIPVATSLPEPGAQQATSVQRERGDEVEEQQHRVGARQPRDAAFDQNRPAGGIKRERRGSKQDREG